MRKVLLLAGFLLLAGCGNNEVELNGAKISYEKLIEEIQSSETELTKINEELEAKGIELAELEEAFEAKKDKYEGLEELSKNRDGVTSKVIESEKKLGLLEFDIEEAQTKLDTLKGDIVKAKGEPIKVSAGYYTIGDDIVPDRYKLTAQEGQRGNVFVREDGISKVADTFGEDALQDFIFQANMGDEIEATIPILLYPVE